LDDLDYYRCHYDLTGICFTRCCHRVLGIAAVIVGLGIYFSFITTIVSAFIAWFIISIFLMLFLRSIFIKHFEGDSIIQNVDEDIDIDGSLVEVIEEIFPHKEGRVKFRDSSWTARSDENIKVAQRAIIIHRDGNTLIIKSIL